MYYVGKSGQQIGPFSLEELKSKLASGEVSPSDLVWKEGMPDWKPASTIPGLAEPVAPAAPEPAVPAPATTFDTGSYAPISGGPPVEVVNPTVLPPGTPMNTGMGGMGYGMPMALGPKQNPMALTGMILGIVSIPMLCCCYGFPFNIAGIVFSAIGLSQIKKDPVNQLGKPMAIAGLVLSILSIVLAVVFLSLGIAAGAMDSEGFQKWINEATRQQQR